MCCRSILGLGHPLIWVFTVIAGMIVGTLIGALHGWLIAYRKIPAFIVTLGGLLVWRGYAYKAVAGQTISPLDPNFTLIGGGPYGAIGATGSWIVGLLACVGIVALILNNRRQRERFEFPQRPIWAEYVLGVIGCAVVIGAVLLVNTYTLAHRHREAICGGQ